MTYLDAGLTVGEAATAAGAAIVEVTALTLQCIIVREFGGFIMRKSRLEKFRNMLLIIVIITNFLSSLYFFFRIRDYIIAIIFFIQFLLWMMLSISQHKK